MHVQELSSGKNSDMVRGCFSRKNSTVVRGYLFLATTVILSEEKYYPSNSVIS
jgi:hypothetical protein